MDGSEPPRLLTRVRDRIRFKHYSIRTEEAYVDWIRRFIVFHGKRHPSGLDATDVEAFLTDLAVTRHVSPSTQNQAKSAILFLYKEVIGVELSWLDGIESAKRAIRLPTILTATEVQCLLRNLRGVHRLIGRLLYGKGMRIMEAMRLRVKDIDFARREIAIRDGKGAKDRMTMLPNGLAQPLKLHLIEVANTHRIDLAEGFGDVYLPYAIARKYSNARREWCWQYVFPADRRSLDPRTGCSAAITWATNHSSARCVKAYARRTSPSPQRRTRCAIRLPRICSSPATTFAPCKSFSTTPTLPRR